MKEFFRGWRRKAGVVTLVIAVAIVTLWMRGQFAGDLVVIPGNRSGLTFGTGYFGFGVQFDEVKVTPQPLSWRTFSKPTSTAIAEGDRYNAAIFGPDRYWKWNFCGFQMEKVDSVRRVAISHWILIVPLTLLSAYLIVWNPRKRA